MAEVKLHLGDCLEFMKTLPDGSIDAVITDPPYNVRQANITANTLAHPGKNAGRLDFGEWDEGFDADPVAKEIDRLLTKNGQCYIFSSDRLLPAWMQLLSQSFSVKLLQWNKPDPLPQCRKRHWVSATEHVIWAYRGIYTFNFGQHAEMYTWRLMQAPKRAGERFHPTQKPVDLVRRYIEVSTKSGDTVFDPFMGSGTTGIACVKTNRNFIGCEIDPGYFKIAEKRIDEARMQLALWEI